MIGLFLKSILKKKTFFVLVSHMTIVSARMWMIRVFNNFQSVVDLIPTSI